MLFDNNSFLNIIDNKRYNFNKVPNELKISSITTSAIINCIIDYDNIVKNLDNKIINNETILIKQNMKKKNSFRIFIGKNKITSNFCNLKSNNIIQILGCKNLDEINLKLNKILFILKNCDIIEEKLENVSITNFYFEYISASFNINYIFENKDYINFYNNIKNKYNVNYNISIKLFLNNCMIYIFKNGSIQIISKSFTDLKLVYKSIKNIFIEYTSLNT